MIHLDANFLIAALRENPVATSALDKWIRGGEVIAASAIAWSELLCGPLLPGEPQRARLLLSEVDFFIEEDAALSANLHNATGRRSRSLADCMIAATAIRRDAALATFDRSGFERFVSFRLHLQEL